MSDPRNNADDAYAAFMSMSDSEWLGLIGSLLRGGVLQPAENEGFMRASATRATRQQAREQEQRLIDQMRSPDA